MFLWLSVATLFFICVIAHHLLHFVRWVDACALFIISTIVFVCQLNFAYKNTTTDQEMVSGYVTSLIYHPAYSYQEGKHTHNEPEAWIIEQRSRPPIRRVRVRYWIMNGAGREYCEGECFFAYPRPPYDDYHLQHEYNGVNFFTGITPPLINFTTSVQNDKAKAHSIIISKNKYERTKIGDPSTIWQTYYNPINVSPDVIYSNSETIPYFNIKDYNLAQRINAPDVSDADQITLEKINAKYSILNIAIGIIVTQDNLFFEKLKRAWHLGKANDFIVVLYSEDGNHIKNINILGWNNYLLKEKVTEAIQANQSAKITMVLSAIDKALDQENDFKQANFSSYQFINVTIPKFIYYKILIYQAIYYFYMIFILRYYSKNKRYIDLRLQILLFLFFPFVFFMTYFVS